MKKALAFLAVILASCTVPKEPAHLENKVFTIDAGSIDMNITVVISEDTNFAKKYLFEGLDSTSYFPLSNAAGITFAETPYNEPVVWLSTTDPVVVNHELFHAAKHTLVFADIPLTDDTEELYAYQLGHLTKQFYNKLNKNHE